MFGKCISIALIRESKLSVLIYSLFHDHILALFLVFLLFVLVYKDTVNKYCKKRGIIGTLIRVIRFDIISMGSVLSRATSLCGSQFCCSNRSWDNRYESECKFWVKKGSAVSKKRSFWIFWTPVLSRTIKFGEKIQNMVYFVCGESGISFINQWAICVVNNWVVKLFFWFNSCPLFGKEVTCFIYFRLKMGTFSLRVRTKKESYLMLMMIWNCTKYGFPNVCLGKMH